MSYSYTLSRNASKINNKGVTAITPQVWLWLHQQYEQLHVHTCICISMHGRCEWNCERPIDQNHTKHKTTQLHNYVCKVSVALKKWAVHSGTTTHTEPHPIWIGILILIIICTYTDSLLPKYIIKLRAWNDPSNSVHPVFYWEVSLPQKLLWGLTTGSGDRLAHCPTGSCTHCKHTHRIIWPS